MTDDDSNGERLPARSSRPYRGEWAPASMMREMERMMDDLRSEFDHSLWPTAMPFGSRFPAVDIKDEGDHYTVEADLPGLDKEDVEIVLGEGVLSISGKKERGEEEEKEGYVRRERGYVSFSRRLALPEDASEEGVDAKLQDGVLTLNIPKRKEEPEKKKKIEVK